MAKLQLPLSQFNTVSLLIQSALTKTRTVPDLFPEMRVSCIAFACLGAAILNETYGLKSSAVAGSFFLRHPNGKNVIAYAPGKKDLTTTSLDGFHMWVQTETHIIDFLSPLYPECFAAQASHLESPLERRMLQLNRKHDAESFMDLNARKPILTIPDPDMTAHLIDSFLGAPLVQELFHIALAWAPSVRRNPKAAMHLRSSRGERTSMVLSGRRARGLWVPPAEYHPVLDV